MTTLQTSAPNLASAMTASCAVIPFDAALHSHLSTAYWGWRRSYDLDPQAVPLQHPDVVLSEAAHLPHSRCQPVLIVGAAVGALVPKYIATRKLGAIGGSLTLHGLRLASGRVLVPQKPSDNHSGVETWLTTALHHVERSGADFLLIEDLDEQSSLAAALQATLPAAWQQWHHPAVQPRRRIHLPVSKEEYWGTFSKKTLSTMRRKLKKFGETRLERITDLTQIAHFLEVAHRISLQTWQTRQFGLRIRNDAAELELLTTLAQHGLLRSYLWFANGEPVAFLLGNQNQGCFHYEEVGYATPFAKFSPGQMMLVQVLDDLFDHRRPEWFDFGGGDADYKQLFANHESRSGSVWLFPPRVKTRWALAHVTACQALRRWARRAVVQGGWASRARQWVRYGGAKPAADEA